MKNQFINKVYQKGELTENGAISNSSTGNVLVDYFSKSGTYRDRSLEEVFADMGKIWAASPTLALQILFYNRMITRKVKGTYISERVQKGQGGKSEFRKAIIWLARYQSEALYTNLWLIPIVGTWKDLWHEEVLDELKRDAVFKLIQLGLKDDYNRALIAKYLPKIRSKSNSFNERHAKLNRFAFDLIKCLNWTPKQYRKFKAAGEAHEFQRQLCAKNFEALNFNSIPGKALFQLVNNKGKDDEKTTFERHNIEPAYIEWIKGQPTAKFTGYVYELMKAVKTDSSLAQKITVDKQFDGLIALAKEDSVIRENVWCALDTSGSMQMPVAGGTTTAYDICISLGVYFSSLNEGHFKDHVIMFDNKSKLKKLSGNFSDKVLQITSGNVAWGSTNFQSVIKEIVRVRQQNPNIPASDFPTTLVVVSDMQFNPTKGNVQTNYEAAMQKLAAVGLPKMRIVWWWVTGRGGDFPSTIDDEGVIMIGGFDGAIISLLLGEKVDAKTTVSSDGAKPLAMTANAYDAMRKALDQEVLNLIKL